jgi:hypothetical protein
MSLRIQLLGQPRIRFDDSPVNLPAGRPLALLAYLLVTKKSHRREHLIDLLFDGPDDPRAALRWTLTKIRKAIGNEYILSDRGEISFNFESDYWLDVSAFEGGESSCFKGIFWKGCTCVMPSGSRNGFYLNGSAFVGSIKPAWKSSWNFTNGSVSMLPLLSRLNSY